MFITYLAAFAVAAGACLIGAYRSRLLSMPDTRYGLMALLAISGLWALSHLGFLVAPTESVKVAFYQIGQLLGFASVGAWLYFCSAYAGRNFHVDQRLQWAAVLLFAVVALTKLTNPLHQWYYTPVYLSEPFLHLAVDHHVLYWVVNGLAYALAAVGFFILYAAFTRVDRGVMPLGLLAGFTALPLVLNLVGVSSPQLLDISHEPLGVAVFALGTLYIFQERFEDVQQAASRDAPTLIVDRRGRIRNFNKRLATIHPPLARLAEPPPSIEDAWPEAAKALAEGSTLSIATNGSERTYRVSEAPPETPTHASARVILFTDQTTESKLKRQEARLSGIANSIPGVLFQFYVAPDGTWNARHVSDRSGELLGIPADASDLFARFVACIPGPHLDDFQASVAHAVETGERWRAEFPFVRPNGDRIWLQGMSMPDTAGEEITFNGVLLDITERKNREQEREETRRRMEIVLKNTSALLFEFDLDTEDVVRVGAVEELYGLPKDEIPGGHVFFETVVHPEDADRMREFLERLISGTHRSTTTEYRTHPDNGPVRWLNEEVFAFDKSNDGHRRLVGITRDVTQQRRYEEGLKHAKRKAEEMNELKTRFLANMSHEIRTPLTGIIGFSELLSNMNLDNGATQFANSIYRSGRRLMETLNSVLDLSQLEAGAMRVNQQTVALDAVASGVVDNLRSRADKKAIQLSLYTPEQPFELVTDQAAIQRILFNIIGNAIKFTPRGGSVEVRLQRAGDGTVLEVADTGIGIEPDFLPDLFQPFRQESTGDSRSYEGSGLGLAITKQLVDLLGGAIEVDSTRGEGTTFSVQLPGAQAAEQQPRSASDINGT